jgi:hypothetical protein
MGLCLFGAFCAPKAHAPLAKKVFSVVAYLSAVLLGGAPIR